MISVTVAVGEVQCTLEWDSKDWAPDVVLDMTSRCTASVILACTEIGIDEVLPADKDDD